MEPLQVGQPAPGFRLPSAQGTDLGLEDYRGRSNVIVWFTKGMGCPFCRQHMTHLARGYDQFRALGTEILEVTTTTPPRARGYAARFKLTFPYLCDPRYEVRRSYGLDARSHGPLYYVKTMYSGFTRKMPESDFGTFPPPLPEMLSVMRDDDMGFFIVDRDGVVRYALGGPYDTAEGVRQIPSNDDIIRELRRLQP
jgi:peroxiredoxin